MIKHCTAQQFSQIADIHLNFIISIDFFEDLLTSCSYGLQNYRKNDIGKALSKIEVKAR